MKITWALKVRWEIPGVVKPCTATINRPTYTPSHLYKAALYATLRDMLRQFVGDDAAAKVEVLDWESVEEK